MRGVQLLYNMPIVIITINDVIVIHSPSLFPTARPNYVRKTCHEPTNQHCRERENDRPSYATLKIETRELLLHEPGLTAGGHAH